MKIKLVIDVSCLSQVLDLDVSRLELDIVTFPGLSTSLLYDKLRKLQLRKTGQATYETVLDKCDVEILESIVRLFRPTAQLHVDGRVIPLEPEEVLEILRTYNEYRRNIWATGHFRGNYVELYFTDLDKLREASQILKRELCFEIYTFDPQQRTNIRREKCLFFVDEGNRKISIFRGNLPRVLKLFPVSVGKYVDVPEHVPEHVRAKLRDYQVEVLESILRQLRTCGAVTVHITTGGGKTFLVGAIARTFEHFGISYPYFYIVPSVTLVHQARDFLIEYWNYSTLEIAVIGGGSRPAPGELQRAKIICTTVQSLYRAIATALPDIAKKFKSREEEEELEEEEHVPVLDREYANILVQLYRRCRLVILDESHHTPCMMIKCILHANPTALRISLTATPWRADGRDLEIYAYVGEIADRRVTASELIEKGVLAPLVIVQYIRRTRLPEEVYKRVQAYRIARQGARAYMLIRKTVLTDRDRMMEIVKMVQEAPRPAIVFMRERTLAEEIYNMILRVTELRAALLTGQATGQEREHVLRLARAGKIDVIVTTTVAEEGIDIPVLRTGIFADAPKSKIRVVQRAGRLVRRAPGKDFAVLIDIVDDVIYLRQHGQEREKIYRQEPEWQIYTVTSLQTLLQVLRELRSI